MPPPINTNTQPAGYSPQQMYGAPPPPGPPGYAQQQGGYNPAYGAPQNVQAYHRPGAAEVDGGSRSKAQLIVGIDFVCSGQKQLSQRLQD